VGRKMCRGRERFPTTSRPARKKYTSQVRLRSSEYRKQRINKFENKRKRGKNRQEKFNIGKPGYVSVGV
jgi:hypothetical protein